MTSPVSAAGPPPDAEAVRPRRYARLAEHRRRLQRAVAHRWEIAVWSAAAGVVVTMTVILIGGGMPWSTTVSPVAMPARTGSIANGSASAQPPPYSSAAPCIVEPCGRPTFTGSPTALRIPSLTIITTLESLALDGAGHLEPPKDYGKAGWWIQGVVPGDVGPAVIAGHVDSATSGPAVFYNLHKLKAGDTIEIDRGGQTVVFAVTVVEQYPKDAFPADKVYQPTPDAELRLITCGGKFDQTLRSYRDNIVVYALQR